MGQIKSNTQKNFCGKHGRIMVEHTSTKNHGRNTVEQNSGFFSKFSIVQNVENILKTKKWGFL